MVTAGQQSRPGERAVNADRAAVFLDRDGVLNAVVIRDGRPYPPDRLEDLVLLPGVREGLAALHGAGFKLIVVTNQPDVANDKTTRHEVERVHEWMQSELPLDEIRVCYHVDADDCPCRKPRPGMLVDAARVWNLNLPASFMIGDRWRDIDAGLAAGCQTIYVRSHYQERQAAGYVVAVDSLEEASQLILARNIQMGSEQH